MYAAARAIKHVDKAPPKTVTSRFNVIFPICCLFFVAFVIAGAIVLALLPLYLPQKSVTTTPVSQNYLLTFDFDTPIGPDGYLDETARNVFARTLEVGLKAPINSVDVVQGAVVTQASRRKRRSSFLLRRRRENQTFVGVQRLFIVFNINYRICGGKCRTPEYIRHLIGYTFDCTFNYKNKTCSFKGTCDFAPTKTFTVPTVNDDETTTAQPTTVATTTGAPPMTTASTTVSTDTTSTTTEATTISTTSDTTTETSTLLTPSATTTVTTATTTAPTTTTASDTPATTPTITPVAVIDTSSGTATTLSSTLATSSSTTASTTVTETTTVFVQPTPDLIF